ncbi:MAG: phage tail assembly protein [ANME-2 cluster archaeon]|nr:MAG: phage tail assembly protein [ANME-2 cluster archaeon]
MSFQTEFEFVLPQGYVDEEGNLQKEGIMRLATAADEILPMKDPRVQSNPAYLSIILLSRVVVKLGTIAAVNPRIIENLFVSDLSFLQELYSRINENGSNVIKVSCPKCEQKFEVEVTSQGE